MEGRDLHQQQPDNESGAAISVPPLRYMPLLVQSWQVLKQHGLLLVLIDLTVSLPLYFLHSVVGSDSSPEARLGATFASVGLNTVFTGVAYAAVYAVMVSVCAGRKPSYRSAWTSTFARIGNVVLAKCMVFTFTIAGLMFLVLPGIFAAVVLCFTICFVMDEGQAAWASVERSAKLARGRFWLLLIYLAPLILVLSAPAMIFDRLTRSLPGDDYWMVEAVLFALLSTPLLFAEVFTFLLYKALRDAPPGNLTR